MDIYLVRHGQTTGNVAKRHQAEETPLSKLGEEQAERVAEELAPIKPTHIIASNLVRAIETARPIAEKTGLDITVEKNFAELYRPRYLHGHYHVSPRSLLYYLFWFLGIENRTLAGESYEHVRQRITVTKNILKRYPKNSRVVVVSHSVFMNLFLVHMCRSRSLSIFQLIGFVSKVMRIPNGTIIHIKFDPADTTGVCQWTEVKKEV